MHKVEKVLMVLARILVPHRISNLIDKVRLYEVVLPDLANYSCFLRGKHVMHTDVCLPGLFYSVRTSNA